MTNAGRPEEQALAPRTFIEINPFHSETLWYYVNSEKGRHEDIALVAPELFSHQLFAALPTQKRTFTLSRFLLTLRQSAVDCCHFNTVGFVLYPLTIRILRDNLRTLVAPLMSRALGCINHGIVHDADLFYETGVFASRRHLWFQRVIGRWYIKLFRTVYVLSPEVQEHLRSTGIAARLMDVSSLAAFHQPAIDATPAGPEVRAYFVWVGPVESHRRTWTPLLDLDPEVLRSAGARVVVVGDSRAADGPALRRELDARGLMPYFIFFDHRPSDAELFMWVRRATAILCLYSSPIYGTVKTSGARVIAQAFDKPFIVPHPKLAVFSSTGHLKAHLRDLNDGVTTLSDQLTI